MFPKQSIQAREERLAALTRQLESPPADPVIVQELGEEYVLVQEEIGALLTIWEKLHS